MTQEEFTRRFTYSVSHDRIGGGGFGTVYRAKDNVLHRTVAIKVSEVKTTSDGRKTFSLRDEFEALSHVPKHKNIANYEEFYSFEMTNGVFDYAVMQYYPDGNLSHALKQGLTEEQKEQVARQLLDGIGFLHEHKVVHRDLKPSNILIVRDGYDIIPLITDFGLSKSTSGGDIFSNSFGGGTQRYSSPEQLQGKPLRFNTDLWSYGAIVYELFIGEALFSPNSGASNSAQADLEVYNKIIHGDVQSISKMPERWRRVAERCLVVDPERRAKSAEELKMILASEDEATSFQSGPTPIPTPIPTYPQTSQPYNQPISQPGYQQAYQPTSQPGYQQPYQPTSQPGYQQPYQPTSQPGYQPPYYTTPQPSSGGKKGKGVWIIIGVIFVALVGGLLFTLLQNPEAKAFKACHEVNDYRQFITEFGRSAKHYPEAKKFIDDYVADSTLKAKLEAERIEDAAYNKCTTIADCEKYLKDYPNGRYVDKVKAKKAELEAIEKEDAAYRNCTTIAACDSYLKAYPQGRYVTEINAKRAELVKKAEQDKEFAAYQKCTNLAGCISYLKAYPNGTYASEVRSKKSDFERKEEDDAYQRCTTVAACDSYLRNYPNGRYVTEVKAKKAQLTPASNEKSGVFSVSSMGRVYFATGNLQYKPSSGQWRIAPNPWDYAGSDNGNISSYYNGWIDLFGYGTGNNPTRTTMNNSDYSTFTDWGSKYGSGWRSLSKAEWEYVIQQRNTNSGIRYAKAIVNGVKGLVLLPDNWSRSTYSLSGTNDEKANYNSNIISASTWRSTFAPAGAVFLPAAGYREGTSYSDSNNIGYYVAATSYNSDHAYLVFIGNYSLNPVSWGNRYRGRCVRLVYPAGTDRASQTGQPGYSSGSSSYSGSQDGSQTFTVKGVSFVMKKVEGGTFQMGATSEQLSNAVDNEKPAHSVTLSTYYIGETEVTQALWKAVMGTTVSQQRDKANPQWGLRGEGDNYPMYLVSWNECQEFVRKLSQLTGKNFRLPTEAEWEYAARGGKKSRQYKYAGSNTLTSVAVCETNSFYKGSSSPDYGTHRVKTMSPNELGLYDMTGNVYEWCSDWKGTYSSGSQTNPKGPSTGTDRVLRGGSWLTGTNESRVSYRYGRNPDRRDSSYGFRIVLVQ